MVNKTYLDYLFNVVGKQKSIIEIAYAKKNKEGIPFFTKWKNYQDVDSKFLEKANNRTILLNEIVIDLEDKKIFPAILKKIKNDFKFFSAYSTGSKGYHIHLFFNQELRPEEKTIIIKKYSGDLQKASERCLIALELCPHWKTGKPKKLIEDKNGINEFVSEEKSEDQDNKNKDLKNFILDEDEIIKKRVFSSHLINNDIFGFGVLLPRMEDVIDKKGEVVGQEQRWRPVIITSNKRGLVVSKFFQNSYKISYGEIPYEMKLRWSLKDIDNYIHKKEKTKVDGKKLFDEAKEKYKKYMFFRGEAWYSVNPLWDLGTYFHQLFSAYPLKENRGLSGSAKTKSMVISSYITLNATEIMVNPSEATLFRETEIIRPTKYIDEAEKLFKFTKEGMEADNRVELINSSYTRNGCVPRQEKIKNKFMTKWYHVYSPTQISSINGLYGATETRAITQIHTKAPDKDKRGELDPEDDVNDESWKKIRNKCYRWALENWKKVYENYKNFNEEINLKKRDLQLWKPLLVLAKIIDNDLFEEIKNFAEKLSEQRKNDNISEGSLDYKYLNCVNEILKHTTSSKIYLNLIREKFNDFYGSEEKPKSNKSISAHLDKLGFRELRNKDRNGAYYELTKKDFDEIISPIINDFVEESEEVSNNSSQPSHSSQLPNNNKDNVMNDVNNVMNVANPLKSKNCDECDENDECDANSEKEEKTKKSTARIK